MSSITVMIAFYSTGGSTERLSTAVAVGAVQGRARIRLRRIPDGGPRANFPERPDFGEPLLRMRKEYVPPTESDVIAADALVFGVPGDFFPGSREWKTYLELLARLGSEGKLGGKVGLAVGSEPGLSAFAPAIGGLPLAAPGLGCSMTEAVRVDDVDHAVGLGFQVANAVRSLRDHTK